jgi:phage shock protein C
VNTIDPLNRQKQLTRSQHNKKLMGVCGGIAEYMGWDPTIVRVVTILALIPLHFSVVLAYIILAAIMPAQPVTSYTPNQYPPQQPEQPPQQHPYD